MTQTIALNAAQMWRERPQELILAGAMVLAGFAAIAGSAYSAPTFGGIGGEIAARISERAFHSLESPVIRVGGFHMPYPVAKVEEDYLPDIDRILEALDRAFAY